MTKNEILYQIQMNGFNIDDISVEDDKCIVGRKCSDETMIWTSAYLEGNKFKYLFRDMIVKWMENV